MTLAYNAPHDPFQALRSDYDSPELSHISDHTSRVYAAMIKALDRGVGQVIKSLDDVNQLDNTVIIFTSDNGGASYLGLKNSNKPFRGGKATLFEGGIRVPFFMRWSQRFIGGLIYNKPVGHVDIFSTVKAIAGIDVQSVRPLDGRNLLPFIDDLSPTNSTHLRLDTFEPHESLYWRSGHYRALISGGWKLQVSSRPQKMWLYNLAVDPYEMNNLAESYNSIEEFNGVLENINPNTCESVFDSGIVTSMSSEGHPILHINCFNNAKDLNGEAKANISHTRNLSVPVFSDTIEAFGQLRNMLVSIDKQQVDPMWPSLIEIPVTIDKSMKERTSVTDEYIYWAN